VRWALTHHAKGVDVNSGAAVTVAQQLQADISSTCSSISIDVFTEISSSNHAVIDA
jgi:hypothetical protein